jgi:hypothetical protein
MKVAGRDDGGRIIAQNVIRQKMVSKFARESSTFSLRQLGGIRVNFTHRFFITTENGPPQSWRD